MTEASSAPVKTFTIGFEGEGDDLERARLVARAFRTEHYELVVKPDAAGLLPWLVRHLDEPFADPSIIPTYHLARFAAEHVRVVLNGDGGDETFAGYGKYRQARAAAWMEHLPTTLRRGILEPGLALLAGFVPQRKRLESIHEICRSASLPEPERYAVLSGALEPAVRDALYTPEFDALIGDASDPIVERYLEVAVEDPLNRMLAADLGSFLSDDLLYKMDMATMAFGLEARSPFLDHQFVEFAFSLPGSSKLKGLVGKAILKKALSGILPPQILGLPKRGFDPPIAAWLRADLKEMASDLLLDQSARSRGYVRPQFVASILDEHCRERRDWSPLLWRLLVLELWHREAL
jgi:asparagine synthase (glutamine-hydrolysing)